jgi:hypothetical protein
LILVTSHKKIFIAKPIMSFPSVHILTAVLLLSHQGKFGND